MPAPQEQGGTNGNAQEAPRERRKPAPPQKPPQPPMTPMIDVTFQLLLFFILACDIRETEGRIPGTLPAKGNIVQVVEDKPPPEPIRIRLRPSADHLAANYEVSDYATVITSEQELYDCLRGRQERLGSGATEAPVVILPSPDVSWEFVVKAFNQAVRARFTKIGFAQEIL